MTIDVVRVGHPEHDRFERQGVSRFATRAFATATYRRSCTCERTLRVCTSPIRRRSPHRSASRPPDPGISRVIRRAPICTVPRVRRDPYSRRRKTRSRQRSYRGAGGATSTPPAIAGEEALTVTFAWQTIVAGSSRGRRRVGCGANASATSRARRMRRLDAETLPCFAFRFRTLALPSYSFETMRGR